MSHEPAAGEGGRWQRLAAVAEIPPGGLVFTFMDGPFEEEGILLRTPEGVRAWRNLCRHLAVPLDKHRPGDVTDGGGHLVCQEHGARYRPGDGLCVAGPCAGSRLRPLAVRVERGQVLLDRDRLGGFFAM